ncbi:hypothetical protein BKA64DRAFT_383301 [Cadophora sp. MPI-SDFR-AT-0126]|nr:hypothetical protein BKA64DRAFT_383301 [Leotiomycetes sp. MPI-SDFR-AT-0126]
MAFDYRFQNILERVSQLDHLLTEENMSINLEAVQDQRIEREQNVVRQEKRRRDFSIHDTLSWLNLEEDDDRLEILSSKRHVDTCHWILKNGLFQHWKDDRDSDPILWLKGIPGAGKTILSTFLIQSIQQDPAITSAYHFCNSHTYGKDLLGRFLRSFSAQLFGGNLELGPYILDKYANKGFSPTKPQMRALLSELLEVIPSVRLILDGIDEYSESDQRSILTELLSLSETSRGRCKILISSRESLQIKKILSSKPTLSLREYHGQIQADISAYLHESLEDCRERFSNALIDSVETRVLEKADGMFLYARCAVKALETCFTVHELLEDITTKSRRDLVSVYDRILSLMKADLDEGLWNIARLILQ